MLASSVSAWNSPTPNFGGAKQYGSARSFSRGHCVGTCKMTMEEITAQTLLAGGLEEFKSCKRGIKNGFIISDPVRRVTKASR